MFELQMQYLVLQKAGVFRAKSIEAFAWSLQDRQTLSGPHHSGALAEQASIRCKAELLWDFAQDHSLNFWRCSQSLWGLSHSGEGGKFMQSKFKWVLPLNLQVFLLIKAPEQARNVSGYCSRCCLFSTATLAVLAAWTWCFTDQSDCVLIPCKSCLQKAPGIRKATPSISLQPLELVFLDALWLLPHPDAFFLFKRVTYF